MIESSALQIKERRSKLFLLVISCIGGWIFVQQGLLKLAEINQSMILVLLVFFLFIVELFPLPVWKGTIAISFPLVYAIYVMEGLGYTIFTYALVVCAVNLFRKRPLRIVFFNPALLIISFYFAYVIGDQLFSHYGTDGKPRVLIGIIHFISIMVPFYGLNNIIVDLLLMIRPQTYNFRDWRQKTRQEVNSLAISFIYLFFFHLFGNQNRGEIDAISFFFFFSPLVCFALLSSIIANLKREKAKLKALFSISSELNKKMAATDWLDFLKNNLKEFIDVDAWVLLIKDGDSWNLKFAAGLAKENIYLNAERIQGFNSIKSLRVYPNTKETGGPANGLLDPEIRSLLYAPLLLEEEIVGLFIFGRSRTKSFVEEDKQAAATLANQLAVLIKTRWLIAEQEKRLILEERNRIARDIHDGVAQSLAGAIMNLDTADRKFLKTPEEARKLMIESTVKLRKCLKEVRESIYALRPYPTEREGLLAAIATKINAIQQESNVPIKLETRGPKFQLSPMAEKIIFDIFQESTQNALKHAEATRIDILLSFQKEHVLLKVKDNGSGFSLFQAMIKARNHPHFGILHMNEAAEKVQASLQVDSKEGTGTEITLTVPRMGIEGALIHDKAYAGR
ncbi:GAF domain-containing sensor histidine kinase [Neobacillus niacini]|uniref:GAF domain-containing sensor histidine kinase n=1 Tax=Neobacillus niacini TaxID=86668 RepID=UPI002FFFF3D7